MKFILVGVLLAAIGFYVLDKNNQVNEVELSNHNDWPDGYYYKDGKNWVIMPNNEKCFIDSKQNLSPAILTKKVGE